jgi:ribosomal protein L37E
MESMKQNKPEATFKCEQCGTQTKRKVANQKYCLSCGMVHNRKRSKENYLKRINDGKMELP